MNDKFDPSQLSLINYLVSHLSLPQSKAKEMTAQYWKPISFNKGENFVTQGEHTNRVMFLWRGIVRYHILTAEGDEAIKNLTEGSTLIASSSALVLKKPSYFSIQCLSDCQGLTFDYKIFEQRLADDIDYERMARIMYQTLFLSKEEREAELLLFNGQERYNHFVKKYPQLVESVPLKDVALFLGISAVQLSRIRSKKSDL